MPRWPGIYLDFLVEFLRTRHPEGIQVCTVSRKVGVSSPTISVLLHKDDAHLSTVEKIFEAYGYTLVLDFRKDTPAGAYRPSEMPAEAEQRQTEDKQSRMIDTTAVRPQA